MSFWRRKPEQYTCGECGETLLSRYEMCGCYSRMVRCTKLREIHEKVFIAALGGRAQRVNVGDSIQYEISIATQIADNVTRDWERLENEREAFIQGLLS